MSEGAILIREGHREPRVSTVDSDRQPLRMPLPSCEHVLPLALTLWERAARRWGEDRATPIVGRHPSLAVALRRAERLATAQGPVLITGETGVGKELFSRAVMLCSPRANRTLLAVNCAQYASEHLVASELFGHQRGSFTGATQQHRGVFEEADGGTVFFDEVGELPLPAQAMLVRVLSEGEIVPVGCTRPRRVDVRVVAATNRPLAAMVEAGTFRRDLYYRLGCLTVTVPPLRDRGDDWMLLATHFLRLLTADHRRPRTFSREVIRFLDTHPWPGNVRELKSLVETGFHLAENEEIALDDLGPALEDGSRRKQLDLVPMQLARAICEQMDAGESTFWEAVHRPFLDRELNRDQVRSVVDHGLSHIGHGSYKNMLRRFGVADVDYLKAMDFLRHHDLKSRPRL